MKSTSKLNYNPLRFIVGIFLFCFASIIISSCERSEDPVTQRKLSDQVVSKDAFSRISSTIDCSTINPTSLNPIYRNKAIALYGSGVGPGYDAFNTAYGSNPSLSQFNYQLAFYNYATQIQDAIRAGAAALFSQQCTDTSSECLNSTFQPSDLRSAIDVYLVPVKNSITNSHTLRNGERSALLAGIDAYYYHFDDVVNFAIEQNDCFPNPNWYGASSAAPMQTLGLFSGWGKVIKKIINISATVIAEVVNAAVYGAIWGAIAGTPFGLTGPGAIVGAAVIGGLVGTWRGLYRVKQGNYVCLLGPCI
jgi:hypothetical protein